MLERLAWMAERAAIREELVQAGIEAAIPVKSNRCEPGQRHREKYRWRNLVERLFNKLKD